MLHQHKSHLPPSECGTAGGGVKSFRSGDNARRGNGGGGCIVFFAAAVVITGGITGDQYARRKDDRKGEDGSHESFAVRSSPSPPPPLREMLELPMMKSRHRGATRCNAPLVTMTATATKIGGGDVGRRRRRRRRRSRRRRGARGVVAVVNCDCVRFEWSLSP